MFARLIQFGSAFLFASVLAASSPVLAGDDGIITVKSAYPIEETVERLKRDIADKGIKFFDEIDQSKLAGDAGIKLQPSVLLIFGNGSAARRSRPISSPAGWSLNQSAGGAHARPAG
jgi:hypothetical protein